eukprot:4985974-Amphidinium_carterae.1
MASAWVAVAAAIVTLSLTTVLVAEEAVVCHWLLSSVAADCCFVCLSCWAVHGVVLNLLA